MAKAKKKSEPSKKKPVLKNRLSVFDRTVRRSGSWIAEMHLELKSMDADGVYHLLQATLQTLRDQLSVHETAQFASQLPLILRRTFYECWNPKLIEKGKSKQEFKDVFGSLKPSLKEFVEKNEFVAEMAPL